MNTTTDTDRQPEPAPTRYGTPSEAIRFLGTALAVVVLVPILLTVSGVMA